MADSSEMLAPSPPPHRAPNEGPTEHAGTMAESQLSNEERRWLRESRAGWLRLGIAFTLLVNLAVGESHANIRVHVQVIVAYALVTAATIVLSLVRRGPTWLSAAFIVGDALLILVMFHEHLFATVPHLDHSLTAPSVALAFLLLSHVALWLRPSLVILFTTLVLMGWLSLAAILAVQSTVAAHQGENTFEILAPDLALALAFAFAGFIIYLLTSDHTRLLEAAIASERRRANLSRFFAPSVAAELESRADTLGLRRHAAAVMFVDLRSFTPFAETASPEELAAMLSQFRGLVSETVFAAGGTIEKFVGDGLLALFGVPNPASDDPHRALGCAEELARRLVDWRDARLTRGEAALHAGIGLHYGPVISGVLPSGCHDEFTAVGDTVNVAERLERCAKALFVPLVVSQALMDEIGATPPTGWEFRHVELVGRSGGFPIAVRSDVSSDPNQHMAVSLSPTSTPPRY